MDHPGWSRFTLEISKFIGSMDARCVLLDSHHRLERYQITDGTWLQHLIIRVRGGQVRTFSSASASTSGTFMNFHWRRTKKIKNNNFVLSFSSVNWEANYTIITSYYISRKWANTHFSISMRIDVGVSFTRVSHATYDDRFEQGLICPSSDKFRIYSAPNQFSNQIEYYGSQWLSKIEWKIFRSQRIDTTFRPFTRDSSGIVRIPLPFTRILQ